MKLRLIAPAVAVLALNAIVPFGPPSSLTKAAGGPYNNDNFRGSYSALFTGEVNVGAPFDKFNGPFYRVIRVTADGYGRLDATAVANYNGAVFRENFTATYSVNPEGTFTLTINNLPVPFAPGIPNVFSFDGVLADGGRTAKVALTGVNLGGQQLPNIGSTISGELIRQ